MNKIDTRAKLVSQPINTVGEMLEYGPVLLKVLPGFGKAAMETVEEFMEERGLEWRIFDEVFST